MPAYRCADVGSIFKLVVRVFGAQELKGAGAELGTFDRPSGVLTTAREVVARQPGARSERKGRGSRAARAERRRDLSTHRRDESRQYDRDCQNR